MTLKFYYKSRSAVPDPLVASAFIQGDGNQSFPWPEGTLEFFEVDLETLIGDLEDWRKRDAYFRSSLREELKKHIVLRGRNSLKPWTRLSFENIHLYGITRYYGLAYAKLFEDDGTEFDPAKAIPLYDANPNVMREPFRPPGSTSVELAAQEAVFEEVNEMLLQRKLAREQNDPAKLAEVEEMLHQYKLAGQQNDQDKLEELRAWFSRGKQARDQQDEQ